MITGYEININTYALISLNGKSTKIIEDDSEFVIEKDTMEILDNSCRFYGSSYYGRLAGSNSILKNVYKTPIIIEESHSIIFFPISSPRYHHTTWIALKPINEYKKCGKYTEIIFKNNKKLLIEISYQSFENQILRATYLEMISKKRKNMD